MIDIDVNDININQNRLSLRRALSFADLKTVTPRLPISMASLVGTCAAPVEIPSEHYKSQDKEDEKLMQWFGTLCGGTYIKLGGLDGVKYSNSYVFNKALGRKGVLIELREYNCKKLVVNRPDKIAAINARVCSQTKTLHEVTTGIATPMGGIWEFAAPSFCKQ